MNQLDPQMLKKAFTPIIQEMSSPLLDSPSKMGSFSADFERKMDALIAPKRKRTIYFKPVAVALIALFLCFNLLIFSVDGLRSHAYNFFIEIFERFSIITFEKPQEKPKEFIAIEPSYLPEGYQKISHRRYNETFQTIYQNEMGEILSLHQTPADAMKVFLDEGEKHKTVQIGNHIGFIQIQADKNILLFSDEQNVFQLEAPLSEEQLIKIAASLCR